MPTYKTRSLEHSITQCPVCSFEHKYVIEIRWTEKVILFGGKGRTPSENVPDSWEVQFTCLNRGDIFTDKVIVKPNKSEKIVSIVSRDAQPSAQISLHASSTPSQEMDGESIARAELSEWARSSSANARDYCKTMLTISTGAIPVYFAILKYLGVDHPTLYVPGWVGILPPLAFLFEIVILIFVLRPQFLAIGSVSEFTYVRAQRFVGMNQLILLGTTLFVVGVLLAIIIFALVLLV